MSKMLRHLNGQGRAVAEFLASVSDVKDELSAARALLERQWQADAQLYALPHDCDREEHERLLEEHRAVHQAIGTFLEQTR